MKRSHEKNSASGASRGGRSREVAAHPGDRRGRGGHAQGRPMDPETGCEQEGRHPQGDPSHYGQAMVDVIKRASTEAGSSLMKSGAQTVKRSMFAGVKQMMARVPAAGMMATGMATGVAVSATKNNRSQGIMSLFAKHPVITFGLGLTAGFFIHKYRKEIIAAATGVTEKGKDFVLQQKENLADIIAETKEAGEATGDST